MSIKTLKMAVTASLLACSAIAQSIPFNSYDARSLAMGGAGVAVGSAGTAPLFNPALLSIPDGHDDFALVFPSIGLRVADPDKLVDSVAKFESSKAVDNLIASASLLNTAISLATATPSSANLAAIAAPAASTASDILNLSTQLTTLSNKPITIEAGASTVVAIPSERFGLAFYASGNVATSGLFSYQDAATIQTISTQIACLATAAQLSDTIAALAAIVVCGNNVAFSNTTLQSSVNFRGVALAETGLAISTFNLGYLTWGVTPKIVKAVLFDLPLNINSANQTTFNENDYRANYSLVNFDIGIATYDGLGWRTGAVIKNVIPYTLDFKNAPTTGATPVANGQTLSLKPLLRIGISHATSWSTVALDVDITRNDPAGFEQKSQYIALGGELNAWDWAQLRAGYRIDVVNSARNIASVGLGLAPFGIPHVDIAVAGNESELGLSLQFGIHF